jgi:hypothetical protein
MNKYLIILLLGLSSCKPVVHKAAPESAPLSSDEKHKVDLALRGISASMFTSGAVYGGLYYKRYNKPPSLYWLHQAEIIIQTAPLDDYSQKLDALLEKGDGTENRLSL